MQNEDHNDDLGKHHQHTIRLSAEGHCEEDAEDIKRQQRNDRLTDGERYRLLELSEDFGQSAMLTMGDAEAHHKGEDQRRHRVENSRNFDRKIRGYLGRLIHLSHMQRRIDERREKPGACTIRK